jgi:phage antirepressor YoqD-like protein
MEIIKKQFNNKEITFDLSGQGMINATQMAKACDKEISEFFRLKTTNEYLEALISSTGIPLDKLYYSKEGGNGGGTWAHKKLAIRIAQWCSPKFAVQVDAWIEELFTKGSIDFNIPKTFSEALKLASIQAEKIEQQEKQLIEQKPKVEYYNLVEESKSGLHIGEFAKLIKWKPRKLFEWLRNNGYLFYSNNENIPYQRYIDAGYFELTQKPDRLSKRIYSTTLITGKGQTYITGKIK